jgi:hypothetical protein
MPHPHYEFCRLLRRLLERGVQGPNLIRDDGQPVR